MGECILYGNGGSNPLNFKVVGGTSAPSSPKENTIWVNTDQNITKWYFDTEEPNVYDIQNYSDGEPWILLSPHKLSEGDILNFTIPAAVTSIFEAIRIYDPFADKFYFVRSHSGAAGGAWSKGTKIGLEISNKSFPIGEWGTDGGSALISKWAAYFHKAGTVWFGTASTSNVVFNALKKNSINVYPVSAKQYVGGAWVDKTAKTWDGQKWVDWTVYLYNQGDRCTSVTGGFGELAHVGGVLTWNADSVYLGYSGSVGRLASIYTENKVDISNFTKLNVKVSNATINTKFVFGVTDAPFTSTSGDSADFISQCVASHSATANISGETVLSLDISSLNGKYYIQLLAGYSEITIHEIYLT